MMKKQVGFLLTLIGLALALVLAVQPVLAKNPQQSSTWSAAIAYFNPTANSGEMTISYYPEGVEGSTLLGITQLNVNSHYSGTVLVGATPGTEGSAVLSSNFDMPAIYKISGSSGDPYSVITLEFFDIDQAGSTFYLPLVYRQSSGYVSRIGIQNVQTYAINVNLTFIASNGSTTSYSINDIKPQSSEVFLTTDVFSSDFNGSVRIDAGSDKVVAAVANIVTSNDQIAYSYQGAASGSRTINIPAVFCDYGRTGLDTTLHIQNVSGTPISTNGVTISYYDSTGSALLTGQAVNPGEIVSGGRYSFTCPASGAITGKQMSAVLTAPVDRNVVVVVETTNDQGLVAASTLSTLTGSNNVVLPYVEWSSSQWDFQTTLYIMNTSGSDLDVTATFYRRDGSSVTQSFDNIPAHTAVETSPNTIPGLMSMENRDFKGAVMVASDEPVVVMALVTKRFQDASGNVMLKGDSYLGMQYIP